MEGSTQEEEATPPPRQISASSPASVVSPITGSTSSTTSRSKTPTPATPESIRQSPRLQPKLKLTRRNPRTMQKHRINKLATTDFSKQALKRATLWYARESKKPDGLSSYEIAQKVKKEFNGVGPHAATI
jgi:hypothetical protein